MKNIRQNKINTELAVEFSGDRSRSYKKALSQFPNVWEEDMLLMKESFSPQKGETVVEIGAGSGFFSVEISKMIGDDGHLFVLDPSAEQLEPIVKSHLPNITVIQQPADQIILPENTEVDAIWSRGAIHHASNKTKAFSRLHKYAKTGARLVICDIFAGSKLADYFDFHVAKTCTTGHEVSFLSKNFAKSLCHTTGWSEPKFSDVALQWNFDSKEDIGIFLSLLHSNKPEYSAKESLCDAEKLLGIKKSSIGYQLNWPMTLMVTTKQNLDA